ncbi:serine/threonine protein kinase [Helicocarpus griseus UAMH5409]|uniref:Serine/threonine protein kinase n=1 Tax=Helicocarpus griseus UAMH5409 TaxID=1447875 RepID=A0A2B7XJD4_9EURO|nr:serine/threonine protein kinase [Helicocarpus griseus UAMH5409]
MAETRFWEQTFQEIKWEQLELAGVGCFSQVVKVGDTGLVVKKATPHPIVEDLQPIEKLIYERIGHHPFILRYYGDHHSQEHKGLLSGLVFEYLPGGLLSDNLALSHYPKQRAEWPIQITEALRHIHSKCVIHGDLGCHNILIQQNGSIALADFGGSAIDGSAAKVGYATRYQRPQSLSETLGPATVKQELFALGTVLFEISIGTKLFPDATSRDIRKRFEHRDYPDLSVVTHPNVRRVIRKCWDSEYENAEEVLRDLSKWLNMYYLKPVAN